jgi:hypothetical protein
MRSRHAVWLAALALTGYSATTSAIAYAGVHAGGVSPSSLTLTTSTDTLPDLGALSHPVAAGLPVLYGYKVVNGGEGTFVNVHVVDPGAPSGAIHCGGSGDVVPRLDPGQSAWCTALVPSVAGRHVNAVHADGVLYGLGTPAHATGDTGYHAVPFGLEVQPRVNGAPVAPGDPVQTRSATPLHVQYRVTNISGEPVRNLKLTDSLLPTPAHCPSTSLAAGASVVCENSGALDAGAYAENITATATSAAPTLWPDGALRPPPPLLAHDTVNYDVLAGGPAMPPPPLGSPKPVPPGPNPPPPNPAPGCSAPQPTPGPT